MSKCRDTIARIDNRDAKKRPVIHINLCSIVRHFYDFGGPAIMVLADQATNLD